MARDTYSALSEREPAMEALDAEVNRVVDVARRALKKATWTCDDGHQHPRPATFTHRRLLTEINRQNPGNSWRGSVISLAIYRLVDLGELVRDDRLRLRKALT